MEYTLVDDGQTVAIGDTRITTPVEAMKELKLLTSRISDLERDLGEAKAECDAIRELMNCHNLGGWTDAVGPMRRALKAEAALAAQKGSDEKD